MRSAGDIQEGDLVEVVLSGERRGPPRGGASIEGGASGGVEGEVGPETCFLKLGTSDSKPWLQIRITLGVLQTTALEWVNYGAHTLQFVQH